MSFCTCTCFCFQGDSLFLLVGACGVVLDCIQMFYFVLVQLLPHLFCLVGIFMLGGVNFFFMFLVSNCLLTYVYEFFIDICLYYVLFEIKILFYLLVFFPHIRLCILFKCSGNIQVNSIKLLSTLATDGQQLGLNLCFVSIIL